MGIGVGAFRRINLGRAMAVSQVKDSLRSTRLFAIEQGAPSRLDFNLEDGVMISSGMVGVGNWHFDMKSVDFETSEQFDPRNTGNGGIGKRPKVKNNEIVDAAENEVIAMCVLPDGEQSERCCGRRK